MKTFLIATSALFIGASALAQTKLPDIQIMDTGVFPESITSTAKGAVISGSTKGVIYRAEPGSAQAKAWIMPNAENGILSLLGVLADDKHNTLWVCSAPNFFGGDRTQTTSGVRAFDLGSGKFKGRYDFPAPAGTCNDISIAADGSAYVSDTGNGRIFRLKPNAKELDLVGSDPLLGGIDGLAFSADNTLYANNVRSNKLFRVALKPDGTMSGLIELSVSQKLNGPDGMRLIKGSTFIQAESTSGRLSIVTVEGDKATMTILRDNLESSPGATMVGNTAYVVKTSIKYLLDPSLKGKEPPPAMIYAVPLP
ncbi:MAG TPA: SMP-30/gluconolactonase/LRE family protein [Candidatus Acidoferrum sp.]|nr:SMP-30/gluconolactonase/LRE family protein [Candidatus Acidoferrum sp.]